MVRIFTLISLKENSWERSSGTFISKRYWRLRHFRHRILTDATAELVITPSEMTDEKGNIIPFLAGKQASK